MADASSPVIELYLSKGCCCGDSYAQANDALLFTLSDSTCFTGYERVLRDAHSVPLLHSVRSGMGFSKRVDVYKGDVGNGASLLFTLKQKSFFSASNFHIFLACSSLNGPPDYKLKGSTFGGTVKLYRQEQVVAKAKQGCVLCGCFGPDYTISTFSGMDQAMVVLLIAIYYDLRPKSNSSGAAAGS